MLRMTQKICQEFCTKKGHCLKLSTCNALALGRAGHVPEAGQVVAGLYPLALA
jgi:hypothetical protein